MELEREELHGFFNPITGALRHRWWHDTHDEFGDPTEDPYPRPKMLQFYDGVTTSLERWDNTYQGKQEVQELIDEYGGAFEEGLRLGVRILEYEEKEFDIRDRETEVTVHDGRRFTIIDRE